MFSFSAKKLTFILIIIFVFICFSNVIGQEIRPFDLSKFEECCTTFDKVKKQLIVNPDFEKGSVGWSLPKGYCIDPHGGRMLTQCLKYVRSNPKEYHFNAQVVKVKKGQLYEFGVWVKTKDVKGKDSSATICMEFFRHKNGKMSWCEGVYPLGIKGTKDWTLISGIVKPPAKAEKATISLYLRKGMTGTAWFDDVYLIPLTKLAWTVYLTKPSVHTITPDNHILEIAFSCAGKSIMTSAPSNALYCQMYIKKTGKVRKTFITQIRNDRAKFDFSKIPAGRYNLEIYAIDIKNKKILSKSIIKITVASANRKIPENACIIDADGTAIVSGKRFLPIGIYCGIPHKYELDNIAEAGFNCVAMYGSMFLRFNRKQKASIETIKEVLDYCHAKQLKVIFNLKDVDAGVKNPIIEWMGAKTEKDILTKAVMTFKNHPALLAWYINDEKAIMHIPAIARRRELINRLDPFHPTWGVGYQFEDLCMYGPTCDIIGVDLYPIKSKASNDMRIVSYAMKCVEATGLPCWVVPQLFNYAAYQPKEFRANYRAPSETEIRSEVIDMAAHGAKGFVFYAYEVLSYNGQFKTEWAKVKRVIRFVRYLAPFILSSRKVERIIPKKMIGSVVVSKMFDDNGRELILISGEGPGESYAVFDLSNADTYKSLYGNTVIRNKQCIFRGKDICSDVLVKQ